LFGSSVAVPAIAMAHGGRPGIVPVAFADQFTVLPDRVPLADPATVTLPMQVALNVPDPDVPLNSVTAHRKLTQESWSDPDAPGSDCSVAQVPPSADEAVGLGLVLVPKSKQAALAPAATIVRRIMASRFMSAPALYNLGQWRF
jgi:hypothetical protein